MTIMLLIFVWATILSISLNVSVKDLAICFKNPKLLVNSLIVSLLVGPLVAIILGNLMGLPQDTLIPLVVYMTIGGAPFGPKLVQMANGDAKYSVIFLIILNVGVIIFSPIILSLLLGEVDIDVMSIISTLIILVVIPLIVGMIAKKYAETQASKVAPIMAKLSTILLLVLLVVGIVLTGDKLIQISLWTYVVYIVVMVVTIILTYLLTFADRPMRTTITLTALPKNFGVVLAVVASLNGNIASTLVLGILVLVVGIPAARIMGK